VDFVPVEARGTFLNGRPASARGMEVRLFRFFDERHSAPLRSGKRLQTLLRGQLALDGYPPTFWEWKASRSSVKTPAVAKDAKASALASAR
jgi:hypothetical protein